jgi:hypothetical protein
MMAESLPPGDYDAQGCPSRCGRVRCLAEPPPDSRRYRPIIVSDAPWPTPTIRPQHPRLYVNEEGLRRLRARWNDPAYAEVVAIYRGKANPLAQALSYLATGERGLCEAAVAGVARESYALSGPPQATYGDTAALVFDWCYPALSAVEKSQLIAEIERRTALREAALMKRFQWHEAHYLGLHAYLLGVLAVEGEPGASPRIAKARNAIQNYIELGNEIHGDGTYDTYAYQDLFLITPAILWSVATGQDVVRRDRYALNRPEVLLRMLSADGSNFMVGPGDQSADGRGLMVRASQPSALGPLMLADYLKDGFDQYVGEEILRHQGWGRTANAPQWLSLLFFDDSLKAVSPEAAGIPLTRRMPIGGVVNMRSAWGIADPSAEVVNAWLYAGPRLEHAEPDAGHFVIWRGMDDLIVSGANYFGSPSKYRDQWGGLSFARNTMIFSPAGVNNPDRAGSQSMRYDKLRSAARFPVADALVWYRGYAALNAEIIDFRDLGRAVMTTADLTNAYDLRYVQRYRRSVIYVPPDVFIVDDRFTVQDVDRVRMLFHLRERPVIDGMKVLAGSNEAGVLEAQGSKAEALRGASQATIQVLWPVPADLVAVGGPGFENYIDGADVDAATTAVDWLLEPRRKATDLAERLDQVGGQWRLEVDATPRQTSGEMIVAVTVGPRGAVSPSFQLMGKGADRRLIIDKGGQSLAIGLPDSSAERQGFVCAP